MLEISSLKSISQSLLSAYNTGFMSSERHMQALLFQSLNPILASKKFTLLVEPKIVTNIKCAVSRSVPDMLVVSDNRVCGVIEIKYVPYTYVNNNKDLSTFCSFYSLIGKSEIELYLKGTPVNGGFDKTHPFSIDQNLRVYYFVIARKDSAIFNNGDEIVRSFLGQFGNFHFQSVFILIDPEKDPEHSEIRIVL